ncbi:MAG: HlyD family secretion protein [Chthoniobacterales bacterium]
MKTRKHLITFGVLVLAGLAALLLFSRYEHNPWTRDAQIQANIVGIAPRIAGPIINIPITDNQVVKKGDLLFEIDPATYQAAVANAQANVEKAQADLTQKTQSMARQTELYKQKVTDVQDYQNAQDSYNATAAQLNAAIASLKTAQLNLSYTKIFAPVNGYLTNVNTSPGTYVNAGEQLLALVDASSFWVAAYFEETQIKFIQEGNPVEIMLMGHFWQPFDGIVKSIGWGIFINNGATEQLLPQVYQTIAWVRLPQRFPVRIHITGKPPVPLRIGQTASVSVHPVK